MNEYEELLAKALACLGEAPKIEDPALRAKVLELVYQSQQVAQGALLREVDGALSNLNGASSNLVESANLNSPAPQTNPKARV